MKQSDSASQLSIFFERAIVCWLFVFALFAPHSIAVAQIAWLIAATMWVIKILAFPRTKTWRTRQLIMRYGILYSQWNFSAGFRCRWFQSAKCGLQSVHNRLSFCGKCPRDDCQRAGSNN